MTIGEKSIAEYPAAGLGSGTTYLDWAAIFGGAFIAIALSLLLAMFGSAVGLSVTSPWTGGVNATTLTLGSAIWFALISLFSVGAGAYFSGRLRPRVEIADRTEIEFRDGANGIVTWALSLVVGVLVAVYLASVAISTSTSIAANPSSATGQVVAETINSPIVEATVDRLFRPTSPPAPAAQQSVPPASDPSDITPDQRRQVTRILSSKLLNGDISPDDRAYISRIVARNTGVSAEQAGTRLNSLLAEARVTAVAKAEDVRKATAITGFWTTFVLLVSGLLAWWAGILGGSHRDQIG